MKLQRASIGKQGSGEKQHTGKIADDSLQCSIPLICIGWKRIQMPAA